MSRATLLLAALLTASAAVWAAISHLVAVSGAAPVLTFLACLTGAFVLYAAAGGPGQALRVAP